MLRVYRKSIVFLVIIGFLFLCVYTAFTHDIEVNIKEVKDAPEKYVDKKVVLKGKLKLVGDYWKEHEFVLEDTQGNQVAVIPWAPYEVMISPFEEIQKKAPKTMSYYIGKELLITGQIKSNKGDKPNIKSKYYVEVELVDELQG